ncbi:MAG: TIGR03619 family F420-dependent LLM class oxidoreductase [Myxococcota bacterium]|nr:TIGR03619 family F420-dependent LLM class oxidoreductase [Myxococcota bacterium]
MKFCCTLSFVNPEYYLELAQLGDEHGWDTFALSDHVVNPDVIEARYPYNEDGSRMWTHETPWPDVWVATAAMAAVTQRLEFIQAVYVLPMREPFSVAKALGTAALLSNYRVSLGLGLGWMHDEFEILGHSFKGRGKRNDEMIEAMRLLWTGDLVEYHGEHIDFPPLAMSPGMKGDIPIVIGGISEPAMRRTAKYGDGWAPAYLTVDQTRDGIARIKQMQKEYGREDVDLQVYCGCIDAFDLDGFKRMEDAGVTHLLTTPWLFGKPVDYKQLVKGHPLETLRDGLQRFADDVIAKL